MIEVSNNQMNESNIMPDDACRARKVGVESTNASDNALATNNENNEHRALFNTEQRTEVV